MIGLSVLLCYDGLWNNSSVEDKMMIQKNKTLHNYSYSLPPEIITELCFRLTEFLLLAVSWLNNIRLSQPVWRAEPPPLLTPSNSHLEQIHYFPNKKNWTLYSLRLQISWWVDLEPMTIPWKRRLRPCERSKALVSYYH